MKDQDILITSLADKLSIEDNLITYAVSLDKRDWKELESLFDKNASAEYGSQELGLHYKCTSRQEIIKMCEDNLNGCGPTQHLFGNFRININGNIASSTCSAHIGHVGKEPNQKKYWEIWAEYHDCWTKKDGKWRINARRMIVTQEFGDSEKILGP
jgi:hypothetical protein